MYKAKIDNLLNLINKIKNDINLPIISEFLEWFYEKINIHFSKKTPNLVVNIWDIYEVELWINIWSELNKKRPCVAISQWVFNRWNTAIFIPLKSIKRNTRLWNISFKINQEWTWLLKNSYISLFNIKEISKKRIWEKIGKLNNKDILNIKNWLKIIFNIK